MPNENFPFSAYLLRSQMDARVMLVLRNYHIGLHLSVVKKCLITSFKQDKDHFEL